MRGHVCVFTSAHPVDDVRVNSKIAQSFLEYGFRVSWVGPKVSYFTDAVEPDPRIDYRLVELGRSRLDRLRSSSTVARRASDLPSVDWWYAPDPDAAAAAVRLAEKRGGRVLFDVHELFHGAYLDRWLRGNTLRPVREVVRRRIAAVCGRADLVSGVNETVLRPYVSMGDRTVIVRSCAPRWFSDGLVFGDGSAGDDMTVMHGKAIPTNGTLVVLEALAAALQQTDRIRLTLSEPPDGRSSAFLTSVRQRVSTLGISDGVTIHAGLPHEKMPELLGACDVGMIAYGRGLGGYSLPNRFFEYMAVGLAVLAPSYSPEMRKIIEREAIGLTADFEDPDDVARALIWLRNNPEERRAMGHRARKAFVRRYNWDIEFLGLLRAMDRVCNPTRSSTV